MITIPERHTQTDGRTDGQTTYDLITALCVASRGNNDDFVFEKRKTESIAKSIGIDYWQYFCWRVLVLVLPILFAASISIGIGSTFRQYC